LQSLHEEQAFAASLEAVAVEVKPIALSASTRAQKAI
jgi:hypothetical protein